MPTLGRLRRAGGGARLETVFEGFSVPAVQADFTGRSSTQLVNLIRNFRARDLAIESAFTTVRQAGWRTLAVGEHVFKQFGADLERIAPTEPTDDYVLRDHARPALALAMYTRQDHAVVVCHYESTDWVAHEGGITGVGYRLAFAAADSIVASFAAARRQNDVLIVFGDHGHDAHGEHKTGMEIPTALVAVGPGIPPGTTWHNASVRDVRGLMESALGLPPKDNNPLVNGELADHTPTTGIPALPVWLLALAIPVAALLTRAVMAIAFPGSAAGWSLALLLPGLVVSAEFVLQQQWSPLVTLFPVLVVGLALTEQGTSLLDRRITLAAGATLGIWFITRLTPVWEPAGMSLQLHEPTGLGDIVPLYAMAIITKSATLWAITGMARTMRALLTSLAVGVVLALLSFRVVDEPIAYLLVIGAAAAVLVRNRTAGTNDPARQVASRRMAWFALVWATFTFTVRVPIYLYAFTDIFLWIALRLASRPIWQDALVASGIVALTCVWYPPGIEWSMLYTLFPAALVENHVSWFLPFIVLRVPILLALWCAATGKPPRASLAALLVFATLLHFTSVLLVRQTTLPGERLWQLAEHGGYLLLFAVSALLTARVRSQSESADPQSAASGVVSPA